MITKFSLIIKIFNYHMRKYLLLNELGITKWQLVRPEVLKGYATIHIPTQIRLLMITPEKNNFSTQPLLQDILLACQLTNEQVMWLTQNQLSRIKVEHTLIYCYWGELSTPVLSHIDSKQCWQLPEFTQFCQSASAKKALWQKIQSYLNHFTE